MHTAQWPVALSSTGNYGSPKMKSLLNEELVKQVFFYSDEKRPDPLIADEVDIVQFAEKLEAVLRPLIAAEEHKRCVTIVAHMNREVANGLQSQHP